MQTTRAATGRRALIALIALICAGAVTACGSGGSTPTDVSGATTATGTASPVNLSRCMRANGLPKFPDPTTGSGGTGFEGLGLSIEGDLTVDGITFSGPAAKRAEKACKAYLPGGGPPPPALSASQRKAILANAECMRTHGVPNFPDPTFPSGGGAINNIPDQINPQSPAFQKAAKACGGGKGPRIFVGP